MMQRIYGVVGWKNMGKTTLVERLVAEFRARGFTVSTLKHAHHQVDVDHEGKDSWRHRAAGAGEVLVASSSRWALMHELRGAPPPGLEELLARLSPCDLVLIEGYKRDGHAKIEAALRPGREGLLAKHDASVKAVAAGYATGLLDRPCFALDDVAGIADFIAAEVGLG